MLTASCWCDGLDLFIAVRKMATKPAGEKCWWAITIYNQTIISFPFCCCERHLRSYTALKHQYDTYILKRFPATPNLFTAWSGVSVTSAQPYVQITQTLFDFLEMGKKNKKLNMLQQDWGQTWPSRADTKNWVWLSHVGALNCSRGD